MIETRTGVLDELRDRFPDLSLLEQDTVDGLTTAWLQRERVHEVLAYLKCEAPQPYRVLYDLTAIDERTRVYREGQPESDFTIVYTLLSYDRNAYVRLKTPLLGDAPSMPSMTSIWPSANWYECEVYDMFGITFDGHPKLRRILMPPWWEGHPLRKEHPARATDMEPFSMSEARHMELEEQLRFDPENWGLQRSHDGTDFMFLNVGPQHPGTHGVLRIILQLDGEEIVDALPDIGYHHRAKEKMGERQSWHTFIPYTDRVDYLQGVLNNLAYLMSVERMAGIEVPDRAKVIRVMMCELYRIASHLVWYGTFAQDIGQLSPVFYMFTDRERAFEITEAICGGRMHPNWFRIGGTAADLPNGWEELVRGFLRYLPPRLDEYERMVMRNRIFQARTKGVGAWSLEEALEWGITGPNLRACGMEWDLRKKQPYSGYDQFDFEIPIGTSGDCFDRAIVHVAEMRQSLRIIEQCVDNMPSGSHKADHPLTTPPLKDRTMHDIETLIAHFLSVSWGPVIPPGEAMVPIEASKGSNGYYLISDGNTTSYRTRIRTPSFPHMQALPLTVRGSLVPDLLAVLGSIDFVLADVDR